MKFFTKFRMSIAVSAILVMLFFGFAEVPQARADGMDDWINAMLSGWNISYIPIGELFFIGTIILAYLVALWMLWYDTRDKERFYSQRSAMYAGCLADTPDEYEHDLCDPLLSVEPPESVFGGN